MSYFVGLLVGLVAAVAVGAVVELAIVRRFFRAPRLTLTVATIGTAALLAFGSLMLPRLWGERALNTRIAALDEAGNDGVGVWRRAHGGKRFVNEEDVPTPNPFADPEDTVTVVEELPDEDTPPDYPPPPGSPAAG